MNAANSASNASSRCVASTCVQPVARNRLRVGRGRCALAQFALGKVHRCALLCIHSAHVPGHTPFRFRPSAAKLQTLAVRSSLHESECQCSSGQEAQRDAAWCRCIYGACSGVLGQVRLQWSFGGRSDGRGGPSRSSSTLRGAVKTDAPAERQRRRSPASTEKQERATRATRAQPARASGARPGAPDVEAQLDPHALPLGQAHGPQHLRAPGGASHHVAAYTAPACQPSGWIVCVCVCMHRVTPRTRHSSAAARWRGVRTLSSSQPRPVEPCSAAIPPAAARAPPGVGSGCNRPAATPGRPLRPHRCLPRTK